jgi:hypothetical protein
MCNMQLFQSGADGAFIARRAQHAKPRPKLPGPISAQPS